MPKGVVVAIQRETQRQRQLEFLQITANPIDMQITGVKGRASVLRAVADGIGLDGEEIVPPEDVIAQQQAGAGAPPGAPPGAPAGAPGEPAAPGAPPGAPQAPQTNVVGATPGASPGTPPNPAQGPG